MRTASTAIASTIGQATNRAPGIPSSPGRVQSRTADAWRIAMIGGSNDKVHDAVYEAVHALEGDAAAE